MSNLGGISFTQSANTRYYLANVQVPANTTPFPGLQSTFALDPDCPFFKFYAALAGNDANGWATTATFSLNGTVAGSSVTYFWGAVGVLPPVTTINLYNTLDVFKFFSSYLNSSNVIQAAGLGSLTTGFIARYTAKADSVKLVTAPIGAYVPTASNTEFMHGLAQAPW